MRQEAGPGHDARLDLAFRLAHGRLPSDLERTAAQRFLDKQNKLYPAREAEPRAWADLCQMLLASNAFLYVE